MDLNWVPGCSPILCPPFPQEDCDLENVWLMGGLSVLTSVPGGPPMVCLLCASKGLHEVGALPLFTEPLSPPSFQWPFLTHYLGHLSWVSSPGLLASHSVHGLLSPTPPLVGVLPSLL